MKLHASEWTTSITSLKLEDDFNKWPDAVEVEAESDKQAAVQHVAVKHLLQAKKEKDKKAKVENFEWKINKNKS